MVASRNRSQIWRLLLFLLPVISIFLILSRSQDLTRGTEITGKQDSLSQEFSRIFADTEQKKVMILSLNGIITSENSSSAFFVEKQLERELKEDINDAIFLEMNSPGGTVAKTKKIYDLILKLREKKPVITIIEDLAASGGYYIASGCSKIFAQPGSIIGSIGVLSIQFNIEKLLQKLGVETRVIKAGKFKDSSYPFRRLEADEIAMLQRLIDQSYQIFIQDVSAGRKVKVKTVKSWADGKIFSGLDAQKLGMIDAIGGMSDAQEYLETEVFADNSVRYIRVESPKNLFQELSSVFETETGKIGIETILNLPISYISLYSQGFHPYFQIVAP